MPQSASPPLRGSMASVKNNLDEERRSADRY
jgi:hypothetical protein